MHKWRVLNRLEFFFLLKIFISSSSSIIIVNRMIRDRESSSSSCYREMPLNTLCTAHSTHILGHINIFNVLCSHCHYSIKYNSSNTIVACLSSSVNVIAIGFAKNVSMWVCVYTKQHCFSRSCVKCRKRARISNANSDEGKQNEKRKSEWAWELKWMVPSGKWNETSAKYRVMRASNFKVQKTMCVCVCTRTMKGQYI